MKALLGNIFDSHAEVLVNTVNCVGVMGKGIALEFKKRYPQMFDEYAQLCKEGQVYPGRPYLYTDLVGNRVLNFPTKNNWRTPSRLSYIRDGLQWFRENYQALGIHSIAFPPLGCGNGGLEWDDVGPMMYRYLNDLPIDIEIYAPYGTPLEKLSEPFLACERDNAAEIGARSVKFNDRWLLIPEVIRQVNAGKHTLHVGRVIYQKLCYALTRLGVQTGFHFVKGSYGPFSREAKAANAALANANIITERTSRSGQMVETIVSPSFKLDRSRYSDDELRWLDQTVDLFCRIKDTKQAEMIATILYTFDQLSLKGSVSEANILEYILDWKKSWKDAKENEICRTTRNLAMLGWITPTPSFTFEDEY